MDKCGYVWWFFRRLSGNQTKQTALEEAKLSLLILSPVCRTTLTQTEAFLSWGILCANRVCYTDLSSRVLTRTNFANPHPQSLVLEVTCGHVEIKSGTDPQPLTQPVTIRARMMGGLRLSAVFLYCPIKLCKNLLSQLPLLVDHLTKHPKSHPVSRSLRCIFRCGMMMNGGVRGWVVVFSKYKNHGNDVTHLCRLTWAAWPGVGLCFPYQTWLESRAYFTSDWLY